MHHTLTRHASWLCTQIVVQTPGRITGAALMAVDRLIREGVVEEAGDLSFVLEGVLACRFEQSDQVCMCRCVHILARARARVNANLPVTYLCKYVCMSPHGLVHICMFVSGYARLHMCN